MVKNSLKYTGITIIGIPSIALLWYGLFMLACLITGLEV